MTQAKLYSRRAWLSLATIAVAGGVAFKWTVPHLRRSAAQWLNETESSGQFPTEADLDVVAAFTGALMGRRLAPDDTALLARRLATNAARSARRAAQYAAVAAFANRQASGIERSNAGFAGASDETRERIVTETMREPSSSRITRLAIVISGDGRAQWRIRNGVASHLRSIYARSAVPWKIRGYKGWPGAPADRLDYTRPGPSSTA
jgi:hypothetical protein